MSKRFEARQMEIGRYLSWAVYDTEKRSWPVVLSGVRLPDVSTEAEARELADALNRDEARR